jgi:NitT/TauT family transport system permease protein
MKISLFPPKMAQQSQNDNSLSLARSKQAKHLQRRQMLIIHGSRILLLVGLLLAWQFSSGRFISALDISSPVAVWNRLYGWILDGTLWFNTAITLQEILIGLFFGLITGIVAGFLFGLQHTLAKILDPFIVAIYSIPKPALAPLFILWFGIDLQMKVILTAAIVFFLIFFNTLAGVRNVDQNLIDAVLLMGGKRRDVLFKVIVPSATGSILIGLHIAIPYALIGAVIGELVASNRGLGFLIEDAGNNFDTAGVFASLLVLTLIAGVLNAIVNFIDWKASRWKAGIIMNRKPTP